MRRALVTGGNRGIGLAIAERLKNAGLDVRVGARDLEAERAAATQIGATVLHLDVADADSIEAAAKEAGHVDVLLNNAGILGSGNLLDDPEGFAASMANMVHGRYLLMHHQTPHMVLSGYGRVVNVSSGWGAF